MCVSSRCSREALVHFAQTLRHFDQFCYRPCAGILRWPPNGPKMVGQQWTIGGRAHQIKVNSPDESRHDLSPSNMNPFNICPLDKFELIGLSPLLLTQLILFRIFSTFFEKCHRTKKMNCLGEQCFTNQTQSLTAQLWILPNLSEHVLCDTNGTTVSKSLFLLLRLSHFLSCISKTNKLDPLSISH